MGEIETGLDKFACLHCGHIYHRHGLRETFCENCDRILEVKKINVDMVNNPPHYKDASGIECIEITKHMSFCGGNCFKYLYRAGKKGSTIEDLRKAKWYADMAWQMMEIVNDKACDLIWNVAKKRGGYVQTAMLFIKEDMWAYVEFEIKKEITRLESEGVNNG